MLLLRPVGMDRDLNRIAKSSRVAEAKANASTIRGPHVMFAARPRIGRKTDPEVACCRPMVRTVGAGRGRSQAAKS